MCVKQGLKSTSCDIVTWYYYISLLKYNLYNEQKKSRQNGVETKNKIEYYIACDGIMHNIILARGSKVK